MINQLDLALSPLGYRLEEKENKTIVIWHEKMPWTIRLINRSQFYYSIFYFRAYCAIGEKTDLNEVIPMVFMIILRILGEHSFRFLGEHNEWSGIEDELYGTYIFPSQPLSGKLSISLRDDIDEFIKILHYLVFIQHISQDLFGILEGGEQDSGYDNEELDAWINKITKQVGENVSFTYSQRKNPNWYYFRSFSSQVSVIKCEHLVTELRVIYEKHKDKHILLEGISANLFISGNIKNCVDHENLSFASKIISSLEENTEPLIVPIDNITYVLGREHIIARVNNGGVDAFLNQKEKILQRNSTENRILFSDRRIKWKIKTRNESALFEDLILELFSREPYILSAKKVAPTFQGDNGRDIICEYDKNHRETRVNKNSESVKNGKLIIQCKTNLQESKKQSIGKPDVDIADTLHEYRPDAYILVVNTQITRDLTEYLEKIKDREELHWVEWWNTFDIEERLRVNPDIMSRYKSIVEYA